MRIFLSAATENYSKKITPIDEIFLVIQKSRHTQTNPYPNQFFDNKKPNHTSGSVDRKIRRSMKKSDLLIAEISIPSFGVGYNICLALYYNIPIICFCQKEYSHSIPNFLKNQKPGQVKIFLYTRQTVEKVVKKALIKAVPKKIRFNMNLTPETSNYLSFLSRKEERTKTEIIENLIKKQAVKDSRGKKGSGFIL